MLRRGRTGRDDLIPLHSISGNDIVSLKTSLLFNLIGMYINFIYFTGTHCCR